MISWADTVIRISRSRQPGQYLVDLFEALYAAESAKKRKKELVAAGIARPNIKAGRAQ